MFFSNLKQINLVKNKIICFLSYLSCAAGLEYGDDQEVKWMFDHYTNERIKECLYNHPGLSRRRALFWKTYFKGLKR
jgi:hypothetical protein